MVTRCGTCTSQVLMKIIIVMLIIGFSVNPLGKNNIVNKDVVKENKVIDIWILIRSYIA